MTHQQDPNMRRTINDYGRRLDASENIWPIGLGALTIVIVLFLVFALTSEPEKTNIGQAQTPTGIPTTPNKAPTPNTTKPQ